MANENGKAEFNREEAKAKIEAFDGEFLFKAFDYRSRHYNPVGYLDDPGYQEVFEMMRDEIIKRCVFYDDVMACIKHKNERVF